METKHRVAINAQSIYEILQVTPSDDQSKKVADVLERLAIEVVLDERERATTVANICCSADQDMAHKIAQEIRRDNDVLIANLSALR